MEMLALNLRLDKSVVYGFRGRYGFLSNMARLDNPIVLKDPDGNDVKFPTVEHFFQAVKSEDWDDRKYVAAIKTPGEAKKWVYANVATRDDWDDIQIGVMYHGLKWKFSENNPTILEKAKKLKGMTLLEANMWGDHYWGVNHLTGDGENVLGRLIMKRLREIL
ncbi:hypothetical protein SM033_00077 [Vibrio phage vB_VpaM_sm033]|nr:hypothetical protein SM033_00077 [Vibrio phage vB_VpaM_sm033]